MYNKAKLSFLIAFVFCVVLFCFFGEDNVEKCVEKIFKRITHLSSIHQYVAMGQLSVLSDC